MADFQHLLFRSLMAITTLGQQRLSILVYHRVVPERDPMRPALPTAEEFRQQMTLLRRHFNLLSLADGVRLLRQGELPPRAACITFDDGYADNATVAFPILAELGIPMTVFVATGFLDGGRMWNDTILDAVAHNPASELNLQDIGLPSYSVTDQVSRKKTGYDIIRRCKYFHVTERQDVVDYLAAQVRDLPDTLMMTRGQVKELADQGVEIGGHTVTHPILTSIAADQARAEILDGRSQLEAITAREIRYFAYPNGQPGVDYNETHANIVREAGFEAAVTTAWGVSDKLTDPFQLPRFTPWDRSEGRFLIRMALNSRLGQKN